MAQPPELNWDDLHYFLHAARSESLAGASRTLGVEHSTIGRRLTTLERALGAALVSRGPDGLALTALGEQVLALVEEAERSVSAIVQLAAANQSSIRLAVPTGFASLFAAELRALAKAHPELSLQLISSAKPVDLKQGEADLALRGGPVTDEDLIVRTLQDVGWSLYAAQAYLARAPQPVNPADLTGHALIGYDSALASVPAAQWVEARASKAKIVLRSREMADMVSAAISGVGIAVIPCMLGDAEPRLRRLTDEVVATRPLSLVYRREARLSPNLRLVVDLVVDVITRHADVLGGRAPAA